MESEEFQEERSRRRRSERRFIRKEEERTKKGLWISIRESEEG